MLTNPSTQKIRPYGSSVKMKNSKISERITNTDADDAQEFGGAPVGLQVMCRRLQEEKVLELMDCITKALSQLKLDERQ